MLNIDSALVSRLIGTQFPEWSDLPVSAVETGGWDNRMFHLGDHMVVRMPSAEAYAAQVEKEQRWLPTLALVLPLPIPTPVGAGHPDLGYPWSWSVYRWLGGERLNIGQVIDAGRFAGDLGSFLQALHGVDTADAPRAGAHNFHRGGSLHVYDEETRQSVQLLAGEIDLAGALDLWNQATGTTWQSNPVWVHGDVAEGNLLVTNGMLSGVIDFGCMAVGDPACDLMMAWTFFDQVARERFKAVVALDEATWRRGQAWALWKALITLVHNREDALFNAARQRNIIDTVLLDFRDGL